MYMRFVKMIQFTRLVKTDGRLREFNFRKLRGPEEQQLQLFSVNVCNDRGDRILFSMEKKDNNWRIQDGPLPKWITQSEKLLDDVIEDELKNDEWS